ncbi:MAG: helix-turn-helix domain-containing protein [Clostridium sp.]
MKVKNNDEIIRDLTANDASSYLNITKRTLCDISSESELNIYTVNKRLYVNAKSLLKYLSNRHYESSGLDCEIYNNLKVLQFKCSKNTIPTTTIEVKDILESKEYQRFWALYEKKVPEEQRVKLNILVDSNYDYNPNLKIVSTEINKLPTLISIKDLSEKIGVNRRTLTKYCEFGKLTHFRVGAKIMLDESELNYNELDHLMHNQKRRKKPKSNNSGTYLVLEEILTIDDLVSESFISAFSEDKNHRNILLLLDKIADTEESMRIKDMEKEAYTITMNKANSALLRYKRRFIKNMIFKSKQLELINEKLTLLKYFKDKINYELSTGKNEATLKVYNVEFNQIKSDLINIITNNSHTLAG